MLNRNMKAVVKHRYVRSTIFINRPARSMECQDCITSIRTAFPLEKHWRPALHLENDLDNAFSRANSALPRITK